METPRWIPSKSANPLGFEVTPSQSESVFALSAGVESGRRGPDGSASELPRPWRTPGSERARERGGESRRE